VDQLRWSITTEGIARPSGDHWPGSMTAVAGPRIVCLTVDAEPPYLWGWRGMEEGAPALLGLFQEEDIPDLTP